MKYLPLILIVCWATTVPALAANNGRRLARTSNGDLHCTYDRSEGGYNQIYYAKSTDGGQVWTETQIVDEEYPQYDPAIAVDSNDHIHIVWYGEHEDSPTTFQIRYIKFTNSWQSIENLTNESGSQYSPAIAVDSNDYIHVTWYGKYPGYYTKQIRYLKYTNSWQEIENLTTGSSTQYCPSIAIDSNNYVHITWYGKYEGAGIYKQIRYIKHTDSWQEIENLAGSSYDLDQISPCIAVDSKNHVYIAWRGTFYLPNDYWMDQIRYIKYTDSWSDVGRLSEIQLTQADPSIAIDANDVVHVVWSGGSLRSLDHYQIRHRQYTTEWAPIEDLTASEIDQTAPGLLWALHPAVSQIRTNRPDAGYAFVWNNGSIVQFYKSSDFSDPTVDHTAPEPERSLYVIADYNSDPIILHIYGIAADGSLIFKSKHSLPKLGNGATGLAVDKDSGHLFVTYKQSPLIQVVNAKTMASVDTVEVTGATDLSGIAYEHDKSMLYCVDRYHGNLYAYQWDPNLVTLTPASGSPFALAEAGYCGIALDEIHDLLYLSTCGTAINVYNSSSLTPAGTINVSQNAAIIEVDAGNGYLYCGGGQQGHSCLIRYNLATDTETQIKLNDATFVAGLKVDPSSGIVYVTTSTNKDTGIDNDILVYDTSLNLVDSVPDVGNPTDMVIPGADTVYNTLNLEKSIEGALAGESVSVNAGDNVTYNICFDNINSGQPVTNVSIVDALPGEVAFVSADGDGDFGHYDPAGHRYVWYYPSLPAGAERTCLQLVVRVNQATATGTRVTNSVTIDSDQTSQGSASVDFVIPQTITDAILYINPPVIRCSCPAESEIIAVIELPQGISQDDIKEDEPSVLYPGGIEASHQQIELQDGKTMIYAFFNAHKLIDETAGYGYVKAQVTGKLRSGQIITGEKIIRICQ